MSFTNLYYKRAAATARPCFICYKPTTIVLATINAVDFLYSCPVHLTDPGFATALGESVDGPVGGPRKMGLSPEEIAKVKEEWEERQKKKMEKEKAKEKEEDGKKDKDKDEKSEKEVSKTTESKTLPSGSSTPPAPSHQRFTLHRDFFAMRLAEHRKRRQMTQVKELAPRLPGAPRGSVPDPS